MEGLLFTYELQQRMSFRKGGDNFSEERDRRAYIQIRITIVLVVSKRGGHLQLGKILKDYYSNTNSNIDFCFEKGRTSSVRKEIEGLLFKYE